MSMHPLLAERIAAAQAQGDLPARLAPEAVARVIIALFQGFILQQAWDEQIDIDSYVEVIAAAFDALVSQAIQECTPTANTIKRYT